MVHDSFSLLEAQRLHALQELRLLDTPAEEKFDRITRLAAKSFQVPIALVTLIDDERQWCKSAHGIELEGTREIPRHVAFCDYTIQQQEPLVVPDTTLDPRFANNPSVVGPMHIRFYAGVPLRTSQGYALGSLCLLDFQPREFDPSQLGLLMDLAAVVMDEMEDRRITLEAQGYERRLRTLISSTSDIITLLDAKGTILYESEAVTRVLGYTPQELVGRQAFEFAHPDDIPTVLPRFMRVVEHGHTGASITFRFAHRDGGWRVLEVAATNCLNDPDIGAIVINSRDVTDRHRVENALHHTETLFKSAFELSATGMALVGLNGAWLRVNRRISEMLRYSPEELLSLTFQDLTVPEDLARDLELLQQLVQGEVSSYELEKRYYRKDGQIIWTSLHVSLVRDPQGNPLYFISQVQDISARKGTEAALQSAKEEAEAANLAKSEFLSRMSHELRTPLNAILGFGQLLELSDLVPEDKQSVTQILKGGSHLLELINEVLDISRIESGTLSISSEPVNLYSVVTEVIDLLRPLAREKNVQLRFEPQPGQTADDLGHFVVADHQRLKQVILNIVSNAIKYNRRDGWVSVGCELGRRPVKPDFTGDKEPLDSWRLWIRDSGRGLSSEKLARLFTPFDRLGAEGSGIDGTGIGLALSKRLVELMGGTLSAQGREGEGCTFWVELPMAKRMLHTLELAPLPGTEAFSTRWLVLTIEDNISNLELLQRLLAHRPEIKLISAIQGVMGLELARQHCPDLILLDLHLPEMEGEEVLSRLKHSAATRDIPVVVISADATPGRIDRLLKAGAHDFVAKPFDIKHLLRVLNDVLKPVSIAEGADCFGGRKS